MLQTSTLRVLRDSSIIDVTITESGSSEVIGHLKPIRALHELDAALDDRQREIVDIYLTAAIAALRRLL